MKYLLLISIFSFLIPTISLPITKFTVELEIKSKFTKEKKQFASVVAIEAKKKTFTDTKGKATLQLPTGEQTILIRLVGYEEKKITIDVTSNTQKTIFILPTKILSEYIEITDRISKQIAGRQSLSQKEIKSTPGSFSDALRAITVLPNVFLSNGAAGSIILRGSIEDGNLYTIDGIPVLYPRHYGGIALFVPTNFIKRINVYASAPPINFGQVYGGVIDIETQDDIKERKTLIEIGLIQSNIYFQTPFNDFGYSISSARVGYLDYTLRPIIRSIFKNLKRVRINFPLYIDFQQKFVVFLTKDRKHSINFLSLGSIDSYKKESELIDNNARGQSLQSVADSFANVTQIDRDSKIFINNLRYIFKPSQKMKNQISAYQSYSRVETYKYTPEILLPGADFGKKDFRIEGREIINTLITNVFSVKDTFEWNYLDLGYSSSTLTLGIEYKYFHYRSFGETEFFPTPNFTDQSLVSYITKAFLEGVLEKSSDIFRIEDSKFNMEHHCLEGYFKNRFYFSDFVLEAGARVSYLQFTQDIAPSGWANVEYTVPIIRLQIFAASGYYSSFVQTNLYKINKPITQQTLFTTTSSKPENAIHVTGGLQQLIFRLYQLKIEGFHTRMKDVGYLQYDLKNRKYITPTSLLRHNGFEITFTKNPSHAKHTFSFLINYSLTFSSYTNNFTKNIFVPFPFEQRHAIKTSLSYTFLGHTIGLRFELYSGFPYTPFTEATRVPLSNTHIFTPSSLKTDINVLNYPLGHRMDIRYTYTRYHKHLKWSVYGEIINLYNYRAKRIQQFNYFSDLSKDDPETPNNPSFISSPTDFPLIFNFAFELTI